MSIFDLAGVIIALAALAITCRRMSEIHLSESFIALFIISFGAAMVIGGNPGLPIIWAGMNHFTATVYQSRFGKYRAKRGTEHESH